MPNTPESIPEPDHFVERQELRDVIRRLEIKLRKYKEKHDDLVEAVYQSAKDAAITLGPVPPVPSPPKDPRKRAAEVALWHLTDWQYGKKTTSFNRAIARSRVMQFVDKAIKITEIQRADHPVNDCVILFGGDMIEGVCWQFPTQPHEIDGTLFDQKFGVARLMVEIVRRALGSYQKVTVVSEWGNHGRMGSKRDALPRSDNLDRFAYEYARDQLSQETRLTWEDCPEDWQAVSIGEYRAVLIHGDEFGRGGFSSMATMSRNITAWKAGTLRWKFRDSYSGHYHTHLDLPLADGLGTFYQTGSIESDNRYAQVSLASSAVPSQRLHFIDPVRGRVSGQYKIWLSDE